MTLYDFLMARFAEDEAVARAANTVKARTPYSDPNLKPVPEERWGELVDGYLGGPIGEHCARHHPRRVLAEIAAKRAVVEMFAVPDPHNVIETCPECSILYAFAEAYKEHPDYAAAIQP